MNVHDTWKTGVQEEVAFWRAVFEGQQFPDFKLDMMDRLRPDKEIDKYILPYLPKDMPVPEIKILDVAAGPVSCIGWRIGSESPQISAVDALATQYRSILDEFHLVPPVYTELCDGENISKQFPGKYFDLVHIRNALDHCYDALAVVRNMLDVLKPGGVLVVAGYTDEAVFENYAGLHQWNIRADQGHMIIWRPQERYDVNTLFEAELASVEASQLDAQRWTSVVLRKKATE